MMQPKPQPPADGPAGSSAATGGHDLCALRLYFPHTARARRTRLWHHLTAPTLSQRLLAAAHKAGIPQAILHTVHAGYLPGRRPSQQHAEAMAKEHPLCLELIDTEHRLRKFLHDHAEELHYVSALLLGAERMI